MTILGHLLLTVTRVIEFLVNLYTFIVAIAVLLSWVRPDPLNPIVRFFIQATEPVFRLARRLIPRVLGARTGIDFAPIVVFLLLIVIETFVVGLLRDLSLALISNPRHVYRSF